MFSCRLVPEKVQVVVDKTADVLLVKKIEEFTVELLIKINEVIKCATGVDLTELLKYLVLISVLLWLIDTIKQVIKTYACWFYCHKSSSSSCSSSSSSSSSSSCSRRRKH